MRGTCSPGYVVRATFPIEQVLPTPFSTVGTESMVPISHILWSHLWLGISTDAFDRARAFVARLGQGPARPAAADGRSAVTADERAVAAAGRGQHRPARLHRGVTPATARRLSTMATILRFNNLKIAASEQAPRVCQGAMSVCGIVGYKNDTPFSVGRHLRDTMSACLMVANDRIHQTNASLLLIAKDV